MVFNNKDSKIASIAANNLAVLYFLVSKYTLYVIISIIVSQYRSFISSNKYFRAIIKQKLEAEKLLNHKTANKYALMVLINS